jgi:ABC-2 type transport system ATP-binding protein
VLAGLGLGAAGDVTAAAGPGAVPGADAAAGSTTRAGDVVYAQLPAAAGNGHVAPEDVVAALVAAGVRVRGFALEGVSLEDRFVALTGEGFDVVQ